MISTSLTPPGGHRAPSEPACAGGYRSRCRPSTPAISDSSRSEADRVFLGARARSPGAPAGSLSTGVMLNRRPAGAQAQPATGAHHALLTARHSRHGPWDGSLKVSSRAEIRRSHNAEARPPAFTAATPAGRRRCRCASVEQHVHRAGARTTGAVATAAPGGPAGRQELAGGGRRCTGDQPESGGTAAGARETRPPHRDLRGVRGNRPAAGERWVTGAAPPAASRRSSRPFGRYPRTRDTPATRRADR